jgi:hypothetical protein
MFTTRFARGTEGMENAFLFAHRETAMGTAPVSRKNPIWKWSPTPFEGDFWGRYWIIGSFFIFCLARMSRMTRMYCLPQKQRLRLLEAGPSASGGFHKFARISILTARACIPSWPLRGFDLRSSAICIWRSDSDPFWIASDDRTLLKLFPKFFQDLQTHLALILSRYIDKSNNSTMRNPSYDGKLAEILIECDKHTILVFC